MTSVQDVFNRIQKSKKELKELKAAYHDSLANHGSYQKIMEQLRAYKMNKQRIEDSVKGEMGKDYQRIEDLQFDIKSDKELLCDMSLNQMMKGQSVEVTDEEEKSYEPVFSVAFKKRK
ncbi:MAG: hypothetical protein Q8Q20_01260 [bacterium]|nr:hypothetical protein [bacterium]